MAKSLFRKYQKNTACLTGDPVGDASSDVKWVIPNLLSIASLLHILLLASDRYIYFVVSDLGGENIYDAFLSAGNGLIKLYKRSFNKTLVFFLKQNKVDYLTMGYL